ncbi:uncharacterized protein LOC126373885 isoform X2 [Pectinophora gossypiella]|uniref:uncharacterized protein LOC126373885 isoform X2 n=1 Tax=Pectinophora gossypiella TaxID=13191 RepID=UPI00214EC969|nr:uncharacterized protein LOC126373885 isoform X2 [Pectinophora gossypiella]
MRVLLLSSLLAVATARPSFIAVPADQIAFVDLTRLHVRVPRQTLAPPPPQLPQALYNEEYQPIPVQEYPLPNLYPNQEYQPQNLAPPPPPEPIHQARVVTLQQQPQDVHQAATLGASARLAERPPDFGEYVDFGAHTGDNGAFGWYADFPVNNHDDSSGYRK